MLNPTQVIEECAKTSSLNEKYNILKNNESDLLKKCLQYALDPFRTFGIKQFELDKSDSKNNSNQDYVDLAWDRMFVLCENLVSRIYTGDTARVNIKNTSKFLNEDQNQMFEWILLKDFRAGVAEGLVNKVFPKLIPSFDVQLAQPSKFLKRVIYPCLVQAKYDGARVIALTEPKENTVTYFSRNGKQFFNFKCFDQELLKMSNKEPKMFDGEVVGPPGEDFRGIMQQIRRKYDVEPKGLNFYVFDWMPSHHFARQYASLKQIHRTEYLDELYLNMKEHYPSGRVKIVDSCTVADENGLMLFYDECVKKGYEGVIIKAIDGEYDFKRSDVWVKMKPSETEDLEVVDVQEGTGKYAGLLGALIVEREGVRINVGSGFKDSQRTSIETAQSLIGKTIEVEFDSVTPDKSLRFPRFKQIREDK